MANNRVSITDREKNKKPRDLMFTGGDVNNKTNKHNDNEEYKRQTYYLTPDQIKALRLCAAFEEKDKSEIVREALEKYIDKKYFDM